MRQRPGRDLVALLLAFAILLAVIFTSVSLLYGVIVNERRSVSDAATNLLTMLFGGIIAILGGYVGAAMNGNGTGSDGSDRPKGEQDDGKQDTDEGRSGSDDPGDGFA